MRVNIPARNHPQRPTKPPLTSPHMQQPIHQLLRVLEAMITDIEAFKHLFLPLDNLLPHDLLDMIAGIPSSEHHVAQHHIVNVPLCR